MAIFYYAYGIRRKRDDQVLDVYYPVIHGLDTAPSGFEAIDTFMTINQLPDTYDTQCPSSVLEALLQSKEAENSYAACDIGLFCTTDLNGAVTSAEEAYFKLQLISQRHVLPHTINLDGLFGTLANVAWTTKGPVLPQDIEVERIKYAQSSSPLVVTHVDKFPYLVNYHIPSGVRIASGSQVRLGAYLSEGTTVMPAGYINFNAGTKGSAMIEGRVSAGVVVGDRTDIGGGASIMGTLSGGNTEVLSIGEECLLGANAGVGISLGRGCTVAAGLYVYAGMKVSLYNESGDPVDLSNNKVKEPDNIVKAKALSGRDNLLFIQDSRSGKVLCRPNTKTIELNTQLHVND